MVNETVRYCCTCRYGEADELCDRTCVNADSDRYLDWVGDCDTCQEWSEVEDD